MRKFLLQIGRFLLPVFLFLGGIEIFLIKMDTAYTEKIDRLKKNSENVEVLILGNSHAAYGIDPNEFDLQAHNIAQVSQSIYFDKRITLGQLNDLKKLKYVLISIDYHSLYFSHQSESRDIWSYYGNGVQYEDEVPIEARFSRIHGYTSQVVVSLLKKRLSGKYDNIKALDVENGVDLNREMKKGMFYFVGTNNKSFANENILNRAQYFNNLVKSSNEKDSILDDLKDFIRILKERNIKPILVSTPCYREFYEKLDKQVVQTNFNIIKELEKEFDVEYINGQKFDFNKEDFYNSDHLNSKGASKFSIKLNKKILIDFSKNK